MKRPVGPPCTTLHCPRTLHLGPRPGARLHGGEKGAEVLQREPAGSGDGPRHALPYPPRAKYEPLLPPVPRSEQLDGSRMRPRGHVLAVHLQQVHASGNARSVERGGSWPRGLHDAAHDTPPVPWA